MNLEASAFQNRTSSSAFFSATAAPSSPPLQAMHSSSLFTSFSSPVSSSFHSASFLSPRGVATISPRRSPPLQLSHLKIDPTQRAAASLHALNRRDEQNQTVSVPSSQPSDEFIPSSLDPALVSSVVPDSQPQLSQHSSTSLPDLRTVSAFVSRTDTAVHASAIASSNSTSSTAHASESTASQPSSSSTSLRDQTMVSAPVSRADTTAVYSPTIANSISTFSNASSFSKSSVSATQVCSTSFISSRTTASTSSSIAGSRCVPSSSLSALFPSLRTADNMKQTAAPAATTTATATTHARTSATSATTATVAGGGPRLKPIQVLSVPKLFVSHGRDSGGILQRGGDDGDAGGGGLQPHHVRL